MVAYENFTRFFAREVLYCLLESVQNLRNQEASAVNLWGHLKTVNRHRALVRKYCFRLGLYWQGLTHDLSKYSPSEFLVGAKYYQGTRSPNNAEREDIGYSSAWLHHKGRNKHHYEYWIDYSLHAEPGGMLPCPMPKKYIAEMIMDRIAACKTYQGDNYTDRSPLEYYLQERIRRRFIPIRERIWNISSGC